MCGIAGFFQTDFSYFNSPIWQERLINMKESIRHRGPDDENIYINNHIGMAHTRLSIIDLKSGTQPMSISHQGKSAVIVFNGEIYNYKILKRDLQKAGYIFKTSSDTEVILAGYILEGIDFINKLNGIFSFALYDNHEDCLYIVRDRLGVKPLFYSTMASSFIFASEPKAFFAYGIIPRLNDESFKEIFALGPATTPGKTPYCGIKEVLPGTYIKVCGSNSGNGYALSQTTYWSLEAVENKDSYEAAIDKVSWLIDDAIEMQMISDIPICTFLSGGIDSSLVSAVCASKLSKEGKTLHTYSFDFKDNNTNFISNDFQSSLDRPFVDIMVNYIGSSHKYLECTNEIQADYLLKAVDARDMPCMADVEASLLYFCSLVSKDIRVALTGECADEIFGGYPWFHNPSLQNKNNFPWSYDFTTRQCLLSDSVINQLELENYSKSAFNDTINAAPLLKSDDGENDIRKITYLNLRYFMMTLLNRMDRTSMYSGLEARVPFADHRIIEYVYNLPWEYKCHNNIGKSLLVEVGKRNSLLPKEVLNRKKSPYPKTYDKQYEFLLYDRLKSIMSDNTSPLHNFVDKKKFDSFINSPKDYGKPWYGQLMAGPQLAGYYIQLDYWLRKCYF